MSHPAGFNLHSLNKREYVPATAAQGGLGPNRVCECLLKLVDVNGIL